jgi:hypothetical protein
MLATLDKQKFWIGMLIMTMSRSLLHQLLVFEGIALFFLNQLVDFGSFCPEHVFQAVLLIETTFPKIDALLLFILFDCGNRIKVHVVGGLIVFETIAKLSTFRGH